MQPLFAHNLLLLSVLLASLLIWRVMEASVDIRTLKRFRAGIQRQDKGSHVVLLCLLGLGILLGMLLAFKVPATAISSASVFLFWLGILLIYAGMALRLYAIIVLGAFFTTTVAIADEQTVIEAGPYRLIRHPSYTGLLITLVDDLNFDLVMQSDEAIKRSSRLVKGLVAKQITELRNALEIAAQTHLITSLISEGTTARDPASLVPIGERFKAASDLLRKASAALGL